MISVNKTSFILALSLALSFTCQAETAAAKPEAAKAAAAPAAVAVGALTCPNAAGKSTQKVEHSKEIITEDGPICLHWCTSAGSADKTC